MKTNYGELGQESIDLLKSTSKRAAEVQMHTLEYTVKRYLVRNMVLGRLRLSGSSRKTCRFVYMGIMRITFYE